VDCGGGWDQTLWPVKELPSRWDIDEVTKDHPVFLERVDGHIAVGQHARPATDEPHSCQQRSAGAKLIVIRQVKPRDRRRTARQAITGLFPNQITTGAGRPLKPHFQELARSGITSVQDNSDYQDSKLFVDDFQILEEIEREGKLTARITEWLHFNDPLPVLQEHRAAHPQSTFCFTPACSRLHGWIARLTHCRAPRTLRRRPTNSGLPQYQQDELNQMTKERVNAGFQIGFHAIGDKGVQMA